MPEQREVETGRLIREALEMLGGDDEPARILEVRPGVGNVLKPTPPSLRDKLPTH